MSTRREFLERSAAGMALGLASPVIGRPRSKEAVTSAQSFSDLSGSLAQMRASIGVTGASLAYWDGAMLHTAVAGLRNSVTGDPVTTDTVMHLGSITKLMTTTLMMQLADEGRIGLEDPIVAHLPTLRLRDMRALQRITVRMLLNHTSGINGEWLPEYGPDRERIVDTIDRCADLDQLYEPGAETSYCNVAMVVAGYLVQRLRNESWYTLVKSRIYAPMGMNHALVDPLDVPRFRASVGDLTDAATGKFVQTTRAFLAPSFAPAGSTQMSTAADLVRFARVLVNGGADTSGNRILSAAACKQMIEPTAEFVQIGPTPVKVGLGWMIYPGGVVGHGGGGPGVSSQLYADPASGRAVALLTNCDKGDALTTAFLQPILESWTGLKTLKLRSKRQPGAWDPRPYVGTYENNADRYFVSVQGDALALHTQDKLASYDNSNEDIAAKLFYPVGSDTFAIPETGATPAHGPIRFVRPRADGKMLFLASGERLLARSSS
jgi:CubicO group peptidase (beta-lactamase class C family)